MPKPSVERNAVTPQGRHFEQEIIVLCVRWYLTFKLSSRDLVQVMAERGITLTHTTILRWVQRYVPEFDPGPGGVVEIGVVASGAHGSRNRADEPCFARGGSTSQTPSDRSE